MNLMHCAGTPRVLRTDRGTENSIIAFVQPSLRSEHLDELAGEKSFRYGKSTSNQVCLVMHTAVTSYRILTQWTYYYYN